MSHVKYWVDEEAVRRISSRLAELALSPDIDKLARVALEIILCRENAKEVLEGEYPEGLKDQAKKTLSELEELEKRLVHIYGLGLLAGAKWARHPSVTAIIGRLRRKEASAPAHRRRP